MDQQDLARLMDLDASLASEGLHYGHAATRHGVTTKTIQRLVTLIRGTGRETILDQSSETGRMAIHRYAPGVPRLFLPRDMIAVPRGGRPETHDAAKRQQVIALRGQGLKFADIVTQTGVSIATAKRWVSDARKPKSP